MLQVPNRFIALGEHVLPDPLRFSEKPELAPNAVILH